MTETTTETTITQSSQPEDWIGKVVRLVEIAVRFELHAFFILLAGAVLTIHGHKDEGMLVLGGALGIFKGNK